MPESSVLVMDSTGPSVTKHYEFLSILGKDRLSRFQRVESFSGGTFSLFGYLAVMSQATSHPVEFYFQNFEKKFRRAHHQSPVSIFTHMINLARHKSFNFGDQAIERTLRLIFSDDFLSTRISEIPDNFQPYLTDARNNKLVASREATGIFTVHDLLLASTRVPFFYGIHTRHKYFDAAFASNYREKVQSYRSSPTPVLISTPWKAGWKGNAYNVKCFDSSNPQREMLLDFVRLALNLPNTKYNRDLALAFQEGSE